MQRDAYTLLFKENFEGRPLFKNQVQLAKELLGNPASDYYVDSPCETEYQKAMNRMKAFVCQMLSRHYKRDISNKFKRSLEVILRTKSERQRFDVQTVIGEIVTDLKTRNMTGETASQPILSFEGKRNDLAYKILDAHKLTIISASKFDLELKVLNRKLSFMELILEYLVSSLQEEELKKKYYFNFPMEQICVSFWKDIKERLEEYISRNDHSLSIIRSFLRSTHSLSSPVDRVASQLLNYFSLNNIINIYYLQAPVYWTSVISLEMEAPYGSETYLYFQSGDGADFFHQLSSQEMTLSKIFVWDHLKMNAYGHLVPYDISY